MNANRATAIVGVDVGVVGIVTEDPPETPPPEEISSVLKLKIKAKLK